MAQTNNPIQMQKYLSGVSYPCRRDDLVEHARAGGADDQTLQNLRSMPEGTYDGPDDVSQAFTTQG